MNWTNDNCPVSDEPAQEMVPRMGDNVEFVCPTCGRFRVTGTAMELIRHSPLHDRSRALRRALKRAERDGGMPKITSDDLMSD